MTLQEWKEKHPSLTLKYEPKKDCKFCNGTGMKYVKKLDSYSACICNYVQHDFCEEAGKMLSDLAKKELAKKTYEILDMENT